MIVKRNTYPTWPNVGHGEPGDEVEWFFFERKDAP